MARLRLRMAMSLDGYVAGPNQSEKDPLGVGGTRLHEWAFALKAFREQHGMDIAGSVVNASTPIVEKHFENIGASVMGRHMFGGQPGDLTWEGWWGKNPVYHHPVFVLTHHPRPPLKMEGGTTFHFVTGGIHDALEQATRAAAGKDVSLGGGASTARQYLAAGLVDDLLVSVAPVLLGSGERLFDNLGTDLHGLKLDRAIDAPGVTHLVFSRPRPS